MSENSSVLNLLSIDVFISSIPSIDNDELVLEIQKFGSELDSRYIENEHHTYYEDKIYPFGQKQAELLIKEIEKSVSDMVGKKMRVTAIWTLTLNKGESVSYHSHKSNLHPVHEEHFSIAYYANAPEGSANLIFDVTACNTLEKSVQVKPETGMLVVFNSFIGHMTDRHNSDIPRVVVSANLSPVNETKTPSSDWSAYDRKQTNFSQSFPGGKGIDVYIETPFGKERAFIKISDGEEIELFSQNGDSVIASAKINYQNENIIELTSRFFVSIPMEAEVFVNIKSNDNGKSFFGEMHIGDYAKFPIKGFFNHGN